MKRPANKSKKSLKSSSKGKKSLKSSRKGKKTFKSEDNAKSKGKFNKSEDKPKKYTKSEDNTKSISEIESTSRESSKRVKKMQKSTKPVKKAKIMYTAENINAFLIEAKESGEQEKSVNMIIFLLREFKNNPAEALSKIKILTSDIKVEVKSTKPYLLVLEHLFSYFKMKGTVLENIFAIISINSALSKNVCDFIFSKTFEAEEYSFYFKAICTELCEVLAKTKNLSMETYLENVKELQEQPDLQKYAMDMLKEESGNEENQSCEAEEEEQEQQVTENPEEEEIDASQESSLSLVSLKDETEMERLDRQLGLMFKKSALTEEDEQKSVNVLKSLETLIRHNYAMKIEDLKKLLYFGQFSTAETILKFIIKDFLGKVSEKKQIFKIFQACALVLPENYHFFTSFYTYCGDEFDMKAFMTGVFSFGHEDFVLNRINKDAFYAIYESTLGEQYDDFFTSIIQSEARVEKLQELHELYFKPEIQDVIQKRLSFIAKKKERRAKKERKAASSAKSVKASILVNEPSAENAEN
ncbi:hypothetical protein GINT2_001457 [Glugoides intestinalis]